MDDHELSFKRSLKRSLLVSSLITFPYILELILGLDFYWLGVKPRSFVGLLGVITTVLKHGDLAHLLGNLLLFFPLMLGYFLHFRIRPFTKLFVLSIITHIWLWIGGRDAWHIGASGLVYAVFFYMLTFAIKVRDKQLALYPLIVLFLSAGFWVGLIPVQVGVSFEAHLLGAIAGILVAVFDKKNPTGKLHPQDGNADTTGNKSFTYTYIEKS